ncbi:MAG: hypothetical protein WCK38_02685 [Candidatus Omnitrophota bacterium]
MKKNCTCHLDHVIRRFPFSDRTLSLLARTHHDRNLHKAGAKAPVNSAQLLLSVADGNPHCTVVGLKLDNDMKGKLESIFRGALRICASIGEALQRIYDAIRATAVSV